MALNLQHQTAAQFAARFWAKVKTAYAQDRPEFERLVWWIWARVQAGDLTNDQVRLSFNAEFGRSFNPAQWNPSAGYAPADNFWSCVRLTYDSPPKRPPIF